MAEHVVWEGCVEKNESRMWWRRKPSIPQDQIEMSGCQKSRITFLRIEQPAQYGKKLSIRYTLPRVITTYSIRSLIRLYILNAWDLFTVALVTLEGCKTICDCLHPTATLYVHFLVSWKSLSIIFEGQLNCLQNYLVTGDMHGGCPKNSWTEEELEWLDLPGIFMVSVWFKYFHHICMTLFCLTELNTESSFM